MGRTVANVDRTCGPTNLLVFSSNKICLNLIEKISTSGKLAVIGRWLLLRGDCLWRFLVLPSVKFFIAHLSAVAHLVQKDIRTSLVDYIVISHAKLLSTSAQNLKNLS